MKIGFLSDAHGNVEGLLLCLKRLEDEGAEQIYFLGDAVGYLPAGMEVIRELEKRRIFCLMGNHEAMAISELEFSEDRERIYRLRPLMAAMTPEIKNRIRQHWLKRVELVIDSKRILLIHGRPDNPLNGYLYQEDSLKRLEQDNYSVIVMGHTHYPYVRKEGSVLLINDGSCGYTRDGESRITCALYDTHSAEATLLQMDFDFKKFLASFPQGMVAEEVVNKLLKG